MARKKSKPKLILVCILTITFVLGLFGIVQAGQGKAIGKMKNQLPPGIEAKSNEDVQVNINSEDNNVDKNKNFTGDCTIQGVVYAVYNGTETPLNHALIAARRIGQSEGLIKNSNVKKGKNPPLHARSVRWTVNSDVYGFYEIKDLPPGTYSMGCFGPTIGYKPDYAMVKVEADGVVKQNFYLNRLNLCGTLKGKIYKHAYDNPVEAIVLVLPEGSALITGKLTPGQKNALVNAAVYKTRTSKKGFYRISFAKPGNYQVIVIRNNMYGYNKVKVKSNKVIVKDIGINKLLAP